MRTPEDIRDLVGSYAGWRALLRVVQFGPFYVIAHGLRGLDIINGDAASALTLAGVVGVLLVALHDRRTYGVVSPPATVERWGALTLVAAFFLIPVLLVLWTGAGYGVRDLAAVLATTPVIGAAAALRRPAGVWLVAMALWFGMLYSIIWQAPVPVQGTFHITVGAIVLVALVIERRRLTQRFEAVHA